MSEKDLRIKSADEILACQDLIEEDVRIPEWDTAIRIKMLTKGRQQAIRRACMTKMGDGKHELDLDAWEGSLLRHSITHPQFSDAQIEQLREKSASAIERILAHIVKLNGLSPEADQETKKSFS